MEPEREILTSDKGIFADLFGNQQVQGRHASSHVPA
jgi:hypothetical protein